MFMHAAPGLCRGGETAAAITKSSLETVTEAAPGSKADSVQILVRRTPSTATPAWPRLWRQGRHPLEAWPAAAPPAKRRQTGLTAAPGWAGPASESGATLSSASRPADPCLGPDAYAAELEKWSSGSPVWWCSEHAHYSTPMVTPPRRSVEIFPVFRSLPGQRGPAAEQPAQRAPPRHPVPPLPGPPAAPGMVGPVARGSGSCHVGGVPS